MAPILVILLDGFDDPCTEAAPTVDPFDVGKSQGGVHRTTSLSGVEHWDKVGGTQSITACDHQSGREAAPSIGPVH